MIYGNELVMTLNNLCNKVKKRFWIIVPFIGNWSSVKKIIGTKWISNMNVDVKLLTDIKNEALIKKDTFSQFQYRAEIKTLPGLHAKIYIIDDKVLFSSANLTGTAFSKRYEFGILQDYTPELESFFFCWWKTAKGIDFSWLPQKRSSKGKEENFFSSGLSKLWDLPVLQYKVTIFKSYLDELKYFNHFKNVYLHNVKRVWQFVPIYQEIDSFFNYLFHEHKDTPSKSFYNIRDYRKLTDAKRISELKKYMIKYSAWINNNQHDNEKQRLSKIKIIQQHLSRNNIDKISDKEIETIIKQIYSMNSLPLNRVAFLNPANNSVPKVIKSWKHLLHETNLPIEVRMEMCCNELYRWGKSSISELLSYYYPSDFPIINSNTRSGMKFFGYKCY
ncbi:MAG: hypothetical protein KAW92_04065 [Candidatus Cloacimonetes bacterium]|nr:hypothetical protein [Candidatus Cloacimonadota bacterium]